MTYIVKTDGSELVLSDDEYSVGWADGMLFIYKKETDSWSYHPLSTIYNVKSNKPLENWSI